MARTRNGGWRRMTIFTLHLITASDSAKGEKVVLGSWVTKPTSEVISLALREVHRNKDRLGTSANNDSGVYYATFAERDGCAVLPSDCRLDYALTEYELEK